MPATAIALPQDSTPAPQKAKRLRISPRIQEAVRLIATGTVKTQRAAAERVGMSETHLCTMLARPQIQALIAQKASETIRTAKLRASHRLVELIDSSNQRVAADVSQCILRSEGILKSDQHSIAVNVDIRAGYVIDLSGQMPALKSGPVVEHDDSSS